jgi:hypothetical protein
MRPFLAISRHELVDLTTPWDPERAMAEYFGDADAQRQLNLSADDVAQLVNEGAIARLDARHRWMGRAEAEMRIELLSPLQLGVEIGAEVNVAWWLRPFALPFRSRVRGLINQQIDEMLEELRAPTLTAPTLPSPSGGGEKDGRGEGETQERGGGEKEGRAGAKLRIEILTLGGRSVYRRSEGSL